MTPLWGNKLFEKKEMMPNVSYFCEVWTSSYHQTGIKTKDHLKQLQTISEPAANREHTVSAGPVHHSH